MPSFSLNMVDRHAAVEKRRGLRVLGLAWALVCAFGLVALIGILHG